MFDRALLALPHAKAALVLLMLCALVQAGTVIGQALALAAALSGFWAGASLQVEFGMLIIFAACYGARQLLVFVRDTLLDRFARARASELRAQLMSAVFEGTAGVQGYTRSDADGAREESDFGSAALADSAIQGIDQVESYIRILLPKMAGLMAVTFPILICVFILDWVWGIILLVLLPVIVMFMVLIGKSARARAEKQYLSYQMLSNHFIDTLRGIRTLRVFGVGARYADVVYSVSERFRRATMRTLGVATLSSAVLDLVATAGVAAVAIMLGMRLLSGDLALFVGLSVLILAPEYFKPVREFAGDFHASLDGKNALAAIQRVIGEVGFTSGAESETAEGPLKTPSASDDGNTVWGPQSTLSLRDVSFAYGDAEPVLRHVSIEFEGYERIGIIGPSGAGKSTLVDLLGGFKVPTSGAFEWDGQSYDHLGIPSWRSQIIYIPQRPYIFHATLRENITFYHPAATDEAVREAVQMMGLDELVAQLPCGLDTVIGEGGRTLSGGQAQRIALARAFLDPHRRILLFDEPTAHLDIETEYELKQRMLPLMRDRLVIFATHRLHWMVDMDRVFEISDGAVVERAIESAPGGAYEGEEAADISAAPTALGADRADASMDAAAVAEPSTNQASPSSSSDRHRLRWLRSYSAENRGLLARACLLGVVSYLCAALLMFASGYLIGRTAEPEAELLAIMMPMAFVQIFGLGKPISRYVQRLMSHDWVFRVTSDLRRRLYLSVERRAMDPHRSQTSGDYLGLLSEDIGHLQNLFLRVAMPAIVAVSLSLVVAVALGFISLPFAGLVLVVFALAAVAIPLATYAVSRVLVQRAKYATAQLYDTVTDNVLGSADWVFAGRGAQFCASNAQEAAGLAALHAQVRARRRAAELVIKLLFGVLACVAIGWAQMRFGGEVGGASNWIIAFSLGVFPLIEAYVGLPEAAQSFEGQRDSAERIEERVAQGEEAVPSSEDEANTDETHSNGQHGASTADPLLVFDNVRFAYEGAEAPVVDSLSLTVPVGQKVAVLGRSGAGKSTLLGLARGDLRPESGDVRIAGCSASRIPDVHRQVGVVAQDAYLFNQTLRWNLLIGRAGISDDELLRALDLVGLGPLFETLPRGFDTLMGEAGARFSGGERQRIALARVLLSPAPLVLFDEPTVGLDPTTEHALFDSIFTALGDRTLVVVMHHLQEAERFDRIVFVEDGRVILDGTPSELAEASDLYRRLLSFDRGR